MPLVQLTPKKTYLTSSTLWFVLKVRELREFTRMNAVCSVNAAKLRVTFSTLWLELKDHRITRMKANEGGVFR
jgi:hypothetical protein